MKVRDLIAKLSEYDGDMEVVFYTTEEFEISEYESDTKYIPHEVEIYSRDWVDAGAWEKRKCDPFVVIELDEGR